MSIPRASWRIAALVAGIIVLTLALLPESLVGGPASNPRALDTAGNRIGGVSMSVAQTAPGGDGMVIVPAGEYVMGGDPLIGGVSGRVMFVDAVAIDRTEVTNAAFAAFVERTGFRTLAERQGDVRTWLTFAGDDMSAHPVVLIAWEDAVAYCADAGKRLPSEVEWEKAARGSDARLWPWGNDWEEEHANSMEHGQGGTTDAGAFPLGASPYGLVDMAGNVWEWTSSRYADAPIHDPFGLEGSEEEFQDQKVLRGGSWRTMALGTQTLYRKPAPAEYRRDTTGFRCAASREQATTSFTDVDQSSMVVTRARRNEMEDAA